MKFMDCETEAVLTLTKVLLVNCSTSRVTQKVSSVRVSLS